MFNTTGVVTAGPTNVGQALAHEARLNRLHRLFKTHFNVTEPSLILEPYLFLGNCISAHDVHRLSRLGIRYVLNVAKRDVEICPYYSNDMHTLTIDLRDDDRENILRTFDQAFAFIDEARRAKSRVLVHCSHGQSRSPAIVIAYLMRTYNASLEQCLIHVVKARPCVIPNDGFLKQLILFDRFLVEQRRQYQQPQKQETSVTQNVKATTPTEIPIQHHSPSHSQALQPSPPTGLTPVILTPPQYLPVMTFSNTTDNASLNSSSVESSSTSNMDVSSTSSRDLTSMSSLDASSLSSLPSSESTSSIRVIPIQLVGNVSNSEKTESNSSKDASTDDDSSVEYKNKIKNCFEVKSISMNQRLMLNTNRQKVSPTYKMSTIAKTSHMKNTNELLHLVPQYQSDNVEQPHVHHNNHHPMLTLTREQWDFINNIPTNYSGSNPYTKTNYITEIYDRATNRFIPTTCCY